METRGDEFATGNSSRALHFSFFLASHPRCFRAALKKIDLFREPVSSRHPFVSGSPAFPQFQPSELRALHRKFRWFKIAGSTETRTRLATSFRAALVSIRFYQRFDSHYPPLTYSVRGLSVVPWRYFATKSK